MEPENTKALLGSLHICEMLSVVKTTETEAALKFSGMKGGSSRERKEAVGKGFE